MYQKDPADGARKVDENVGDAGAAVREDLVDLVGYGVEQGEDGGGGEGQPHLELAEHRRYDQEQTGGQEAQEAKLREMSGFADKFMSFLQDDLLLLCGAVLKVAVQEPYHLAGQPLAELSRLLTARGGELEDDGHVDQDQDGQDSGHGDMPATAGAFGGPGGAAFFLFRGHGDLLLLS